jgi:CubicO group peptidase (beta-lactamase class C family)
MPRGAPPRIAHELGLMQGFPPAEDKLVTVANFQDAPYNRWAFLHMSNLLPTAQISRGDLPIATLPYGLESMDEINYEGTNGPTTVAQMLERTYTDGFLVMRDGTVVTEQYFNGMEHDTRHLLMSVSKSLTGALAGIFVERGMLDLAATVPTYVPELRHGAYDNATIQQVLDMTVSVVFNEDYADPHSEIQRQDRAVGWRTRQDGDVIGNYHFLPTIKGAGRHGEVFQYCSADTDVLGWVLEKITGTPFCDLLSCEIWAKLGAEHDAYSTVDTYGTALPNGGICTTLRDLARFGRMILHEGTYNGQSIVPANWIEETRLHGDNGPWRRAEWWAELYPRGSYHNKFWHTGDEHGSFFGIGIHGQHLWIDPLTKVVIVKFSTGPVASDQVATLDSLRGMAAISRALG